MAHDYNYGCVSDYKVANVYTSALHGPGLGPRAVGRAWMTYLRAGPDAGLKVVGPGRARASQSHLCGLRARPGPNLHGPGPGPGPSEALF